MSHRFLLGAIAVALAACSPPSATPSSTTTTSTTITVTAPSVILGVLENRPGATTAEPARFVVRAAFYKQGNAWRAYDASCADQTCLASATARFPHQTAWTIGFDGRSVGQVSATTPQAWSFYGDIGQQELAADAHAPTEGAKTADFSSSGAPLYRPLVANSTANVADPQSWAPSALPGATLQALRQAFHAKFTGVVNCANADSAPSPRTYADRDIAIERTYSSSPQWIVATLHLTGYRCDGPTDESAHAD